MRSPPKCFFVHVSDIVADVTIQSQSISISSGLSAIDTGTTLIGGPTDEVAKVWSAVPGAQEIGSEMPGFWDFRK